MLPTAYILTKEELEKHGIATAHRTDVVAEIVASYPLMFLRPAMFVGKADPGLFLHFIENEMSWLNYLCNCLPITMFWAQRQLGARGPFTLLYDRQTHEKLPDEQAFAAIKQLVDAHLEWIPNHIVIERHKVDIPISAEDRDRYTSDVSKEIWKVPAVNKLFTNLRARGLADQTILDGPRYSATECDLNVEIINRKLDPIYWWDQMYLKRSKQYCLILGD